MSTTCQSCNCPPRVTFIESVVARWQLVRRRVLIASSVELVLRVLTQVAASLIIAGIMG